MTDLKSDDILIDKLDAIAPEVRLWTIAFDEWIRGAGPRPDKELDQLISPISVLFSEITQDAAPDRFFLGKQLSLQGWAQTRNLIDVAILRGGNAALDWYRRISSIECTDIYVACEVYGLIIREPIVFSNGVTLIPADRLPEGAMGSRIRSQNEYTNGVGMPAFPAAALVLKENVRAVDTQRGDTEFLEIVNRIGRTISAFTLTRDYSPIVGIARAEFVDKDLAAAEFGMVWQSAIYDGRAPDFPREVTEEAKERVEAYLALEGRVAEVCDVAISRLNLARRRVQPGDKAIEGGVCLEALLGDSGSGDLTYKLRIRTARLLSADLSDRISISKDVADFYTLRSKVVHGRSLGCSPKDRKIAERGLDICLEVLNFLVDAKSVPDIQQLELA